MRKTIFLFLALHCNIHKFFRNALTLFLSLFVLEAGLDSESFPKSRYLNCLYCSLVRTPQSFNPLPFTDKQASDFVLKFVREWLEKEAADLGLSFVLVAVLFIDNTELAVLGLSFETLLLDAEIILLLLLVGGV